MGEESGGERPESFRDFKDSFFYGSRTDLNFKFLEHLTVEEASAFFRDLLAALAGAYDTGRWQRVLEFVRRAQGVAYAGAGRWRYEDRPRAALARPLNEATIALITSTGHFVEDRDPAPLGADGMTQEEAVRRIRDFLAAEPTLSEIPVDAPASRLRVRHPGYDIQGVRADRNVAFPVDRLWELADDGRIGGVHPTAWSFVGACAQLPLRNRTGPAWVRRWKEESFDAAVLVPV